LCVSSYKIITTSQAGKQSAQTGRRTDIHTWLDRLVIMIKYVYFIAYYTST